MFDFLRRFFYYVIVLVAVLVLAHLVAQCAGFANPDDTPEAPQGAVADLAPTVLLVSLDGFRPDYLDRYDAPTLRGLAAAGVSAPEGMIPAYPTKTFPNHYTLVTGRYPAHHGIVGNTMYDPGWDAWFRISDRPVIREGRWWEAEPIWVTAERQGQRSGPYFWPGSEAPIQGVRPSYNVPFNDATPAQERIDTVMGWLSLPVAERPTFVTLYFSDVDGAGHEYGPDAPETAAAVARVDGYVAAILQALDARGLRDRIHLLFVSDHGMSQTAEDRVLYLSDYIDLDAVTVVNTSPNLGLYPHEGQEAIVYEALRTASPHLQVYRRDAVPARFHYRDHPRIPPLVGLVADGWSLLAEPHSMGGEGTGPVFYYGMHGYDHELPSMRALFIAQGPALRPGTQLAPFENIHLYALMCHLLGLTPAAHDGDAATWTEALR